MPSNPSDQPAPICEPTVQPPALSNPAPTTRYPLELVRTTCLLVLTVFASAAALMWLRPVVVPFLVALALNYLLSPVSGLLSRRCGFSDAFAVLGAAVAGFAVVSVVGFPVWISAAELARGAEVYAARLEALSTDPEFSSWLDRAGVPRDTETGRLVPVSPEQSRRPFLAAVSWLQSPVSRRPTLRRPARRPARRPRRAEPLKPIRRVRPALGPSDLL